MKEIQGGNGHDNARFVTEVFKGERQDAMFDIISLNAGAMIYLSGLKPSISEGFKLAAETILSGKVFEKLQELQKCGVIKSEFIKSV